MSNLRFPHKTFWFKSTIILAGITLCSAGTLALFIRSEYQKLESDDPAVWKQVISDFEKEDARHPLLNNVVLFIGSSSIRFWRNLDKDMHPVPIINRGFGGSKVRDIIYYADRIIFPYQPKAIVLFAGTNDISGRPNDKTPETLLQDFIELTELIQQNLPHCQLYYLPITPTTGRWQVWPQANKANELIKNYMSAHQNLHYLDITHSFLTNDGHPKKDLLWWDGVHLNSLGYKVWKQELKSQLKQTLFTGMD